MARWEIHHANLFLSHGATHADSATLNTTSSTRVWELINPPAQHDALLRIRDDIHHIDGLSRF